MIAAPSPVVVDTSIAVKWAVEEGDSQEANALRESWRALGLQASAPDLLTREFNSALFGKVRAGGMALNDAIDTLTRWESLDIVIYDSNPFHQRALELAVFVNHDEIYDLYFLALAENLNCELWTADQRFHRRVNNSTLTSRIRLLKDDFPTAGSA